MGPEEAVSLLVAQDLDQAVRVVVALGPDGQRDDLMALCINDRIYIIRAGLS